MITENEYAPSDFEEKRSDSTYVVQRGDTLAGVALRLGVKQSEITRANRMYGSKTLVTGQLLKVGIPIKQTVDVDGEVIEPSDLQHALRVDDHNPASVTAAPFAVTVTTTMTTTTTPSHGVATNEASQLDNTVIAEPQEQEIWFERTAVDLGVEGAMMSPPPAGQESKDGTGQLLYQPPHWGVGAPSATGLDDLVGISNSRQASDASSSAPTGVSLRGVIRYMFSPSAASSRNNAGFAGPADGEQGTHAQDAWAGSAAPRCSREGSRVSREVSRVSRDASDVSTKSTAQALLAMVTPSYWRSSEDGDAFEAGEVKHGAEEDDEGTRSCSSVDDLAPVGAKEADPLPHVSNPQPAAPLKLPGLVAGGSTIVTHSTLARMEAALPKHYRGYNWYLLFSTLRDGASYIQLYNRIKGEEPTFVVVESMSGEVFGGFATSAWSSGCQYYGTGECFLFTLEGERITPDERTQDSDEEGSNKKLLNGDITTHQWTGMNTYLQYSDSTGLGMGGGGAEGAFGLFVGEDFLSGSTGTCDTFQNPPLCSSQQFQISQVEVWGFTTADSEMGARLERLRKTLRGKTTRPL